MEYRIKGGSCESGEPQDQGGSVGTQDHGGLRNYRTQGGASRIKRTNKPWGQRETREPASRAKGTTRRWETTRSRGNSRSRGTMRTRRTLRSKKITSITGPKRTRVASRTNGITSPEKIFTKLTFLGFSLMKLTAFFPLSFLTNESVPLRM